MEKDPEFSSLFQSKPLPPSFNKHSSPYIEQDERIQIIKNFYEKRLEICENCLSTNNF